MSKKTLESEIEEFLKMWGVDEQISFLREVLYLFEMYDINDESDWVANAVGDDNERNFRLLRTVYIMSRVAAIHASTLSAINCRFKDLWKKMEKAAVGISQEIEKEKDGTNKN